MSKTACLLNIVLSCNISFLRSILMILLRERKDEDVNKVLVLVLVVDLKFSSNAFKANKL